MKFFQRYPPTIWVRVVGTVISKICDFMLLSFIGLYLYDHLGQDLRSSAMVVTMGPLTAFLVGFISGSWSDRFGRKPAMVVSILLQALTVAAYAFASRLPHFVGISIMGGFATALYWPAANAQVADIISEEKRGEVYALMHVALNAGAAVGPMIGVFMYRTNPGLAFAVSCIGLLVYALLLIFMTEESAPRKSAVALKGVAQRSRTKESHKGVAQKEVKLSFATYWPVIVLTIAAIPVGLLYSQCHLILPMQLKAKFTNFHYVFGTLMSINGLCVTLLQLPIQKISEKFVISRAVLLSYLVMSCTAIGYGVANTLLLLIVAEILFSLGEMLNGPQLQRLIAQIAPVELRGRYFGIYAMSWGISGVIGPNIGAWALTKMGGAAWFLSLAGLIAVSGAFQYYWIRRLTSRLPIAI